MSDALSIFTEQLYETWLPEFCYAPHRNYSTDGFVNESVSKLSEFDATWFLDAVKSGLVEEKDGFFTAPQSKAKEQIFWEGIKSKSPRPITLWVEPVITIGALARLNKEYGWPIERLGMQSKNWAFDMVGYDSDLEHEVLACEVKKQIKEVDDLLHYMHHYSGLSPLDIEPANAKECNAYRKVKGIRHSWPKVFWALGPDGYGKIFHVARKEDSYFFSLVLVDESALNHGSYL
ncbi:hypothetical protein [Pseudoalteromonas distincta]|uniref:hypothetical protein n=1 Tax=Pseudoalteromonas distincta TaxID=77608 RepID=UPI0030015F51